MCLSEIIISMKYEKIAILTILMLLSPGTKATLSFLNSGIISNQNENFEKHNIKKKNFSSKKEYNEEEKSTNHKNEHNEKILLKNVELIYLKEDSIKISKESFTKIVTPYINTLVNFDDIKIISQHLTMALKREGAMLVNVVVPPQDFYNGNIKINIYQGRLDKIILDNKSHVKNEHVMKIVDRYLKHGEVIKTKHFDRLAHILNELPGFAGNITLYPGEFQGTSSIYIKATEKINYGGYIQFDNYGNDAIGKERYYIGGYINSPFRVGDKLTFNVAGSIDKGELSNGVVQYSTTPTSYGMQPRIKVSRLDYKYFYMDSKFQGYANSIELGVTYPVYRNNFLYTDIIGGIEYSEMIDNYSSFFSYAGKKGRKEYNDIYINLESNINFDSYGYSYFNLGATLGKMSYKDKASVFWNGSDVRETDKHKVILNYEFAYNLPLAYGHLLSIRTSGLLANGNLDSTQKLIVGGVNGVRGFSGDKHFLDTGNVISSELSRNFQNIGNEVSANLSIFYDYATGNINRNNKIKTGDVIDLKNKQKLSSIGIGGSIYKNNAGELSIQWAKPLTISNKQYESKLKNKLWVSYSKSF